jgi:hypothetical protein
VGYYNPRAKLGYYQTVKRWLEELGSLDSLLDVGCFDTPVATWGDFRHRYTVDHRARPALSGVLPIVGDWPACSHLVPQCDVVTCLQTIEHLDNPLPFTAALFAHARRAVILSLPYQWPAGHCSSHRQDPVTLEKIAGWAGRQPDRIHRSGTPVRIVLLYSTPDRPPCDTGDSSIAAR